jgi:hypothetical protein
MSTYTTTFSKISRIFKKTGKCPACGRQATRSKTVWHTANPFNKDPETGAPRTREQILVEVAREGHAWRAEPVYHKGCEP